MTQTSDGGDVKQSSGSATQLRGSSLLLAGRFLGIGANLVIQVLIVRYLSQSAYGSFAYGIAVANIGMVLVSLGMEQTVSRFAAVYDEEGEIPRLQGTLLVYLATVAVLGIVLVTAVVLGRDVLEDALVRDPVTASLLTVLVLLAPLQALDTLAMNLFAVYANPMAIFWRRYVIGPALRLLAIGAVLLLDGTVYHLAWGYVAAVVIGLSIYLLPLRNLLRSRGIVGAGHRPVLPWKPLLKFTAGAVSADLLVIVLFASDVLIVNYFRGPEGVALLQAAQPFANGNLIVFYAMIPLFIPAASRLFSAGRLEESSVLYSRCTLWIALFTFPVMAMTVAAARPVTLTLFGQEYAAGAGVLSALAAGQYVLAVLGLTTLTLKAHGRLARLAVANIVVALLNIAVNIVLVQRYGALGAALGTLGAIVVLTVAKAVLMRTELGIWPVDRKVAVGLLTVAVATAGLVVFDRSVQPALVVSFLVTGVVFLLVLLLNRRALAVAEVFPEVRRVPVVRWVLG